MRHHENKRTFSCFCILTARLLTYTGITAFVLIIITRLMNDENSYATRGSFNVSFVQFIVVIQSLDYEQPLFFFLVRETRKSSCACRFRERLFPSPTPLDESTEKEKLRAVYPNLRSGPILAVLIHSPCPLECYFQSETNIEPDLRLSLSRVSHMGSLCQPKERDRSFS